MGGNDSQSSEHIQEVLELSRSMLRFANAQDWDAFVQAEQKRRPLIERMFNPAPSTEESVAVLAEAIRTIQSLDEQTMSLGKAGLVELGKAMQQAGSGKQATRAYEANSGSGV